MHGDWLLVHLDPDQTMSTTGILHLPDGAHEHVLRTGTVVKAGPGKWALKPIKGTKTYGRVPLGVEVGERVVFVKFAVTHTETSKRIQQIVGVDYGMIQPHDVLLAGEDVRLVSQ
jgi:co-chaperonin GroES (HSP10)